MEITYLLLVVVHVLAGAAWFGAMLYIVVVLHPHAKQYCASDTQFEEFIATLSHDARWKVLSACVIIAVTGIGLVVIRPTEPDSGAWMVMLAFKVTVFVMALALFVYASWRLWPARIFATPEEIPKWQNTFVTVVKLLIVVVAASFVLGILMHATARLAK
jgi:putative copper export protein